jgi:hypothetical protein
MAVDHAQQFEQRSGLRSIEHVVFEIVRLAYVGV